MGIRLMNIPGVLARDKVTNVAIRMLAERQQGTLLTQQGTLLTLQPEQMRLRMIRAQSRRRCSHRALHSGRFDIARYERFSATNHASVGASAPEHLEEDDRTSGGIARVKALGGETIGGDFDF